MFWQQQKQEPQPQQKQQQPSKEVQEAIRALGGTLDKADKTKEAIKEGHGVVCDTSTVSNTYGAQLIGWY